MTEQASAIKKKEPKMKNGIMKRGKTWCFVVETSRDPVTGKRQPKWYSGYAKWEEARQARVEVLHQLNTGNFVSPTNLKMKELLGQWLEAIKGIPKNSTWQSYKSNMDLHVIPNIGEVKVQKLTPAALNALYRKLQTEGKKSQKRRAKLKSGEEKLVSDNPDHEKKGLSPKTVKNIHACISAALSYAVDNNLVLKNVAAKANPPSVPGVGGRQMRTWTATQLGAFLRKIEGERYYPAFLLAASTGMRRGEVLGLRWEDVDLDTNRLSVRQSLVSVQYKPEVTEPKTERSKRCIQLDTVTVAALRKHRAKQAEEQLAGGAEYRNTGYVFTCISGEFVHPDRFSQIFNDLVEKSGLPRIRLHDLRHTHATLALCAGVHPKVVSERLGHSTIAMTMDTYSHAIPALEQEAAERVAALVFGQ